MFNLVEIDSNSARKVQEISMLFAFYYPRLTDDATTSLDRKLSTTDPKLVSSTN